MHACIYIFMYIYIYIYMGVNRFVPSPKKIKLSLPLPSFQLGPLVNKCTYLLLLILPPFTNLRSTLNKDPHKKPRWLTTPHQLPNLTSPHQLRSLNLHTSYPSTPPLLTSIGLLVCFQICGSVAVVDCGHRISKVNLLSVGLRKLSSWSRML